MTMLKRIIVVGAVAVVGMAISAIMLAQQVAGTPAWSQQRMWSVE
jgi:hypothetical protein